jgi:DNA-binding CsgD family transcriptional regulator
MSTDGDARAGVPVAPHVPVFRGTHGGFSEEHRQAVLDAAALLQVRRSEAAALLARGRLPGGEVVAVGGEAVNRWLAEGVTTWRELLSVRPAATTAQLRASLPANRAVVERGVHMVSLFDHDATEPGARVLLAGEPPGTYLFTVAPVQMKIVDRRFVLLQGPTVDGQGSVMAVETPACLEAAWRYWRAALAAAFPVDRVVRGPIRLTPRQRQVVALLASDLADEAIAASLGVSVRTVRSDIAALLDALGVRSRFAAGLQLRDWTEPD